MVFSSIAFLGLFLPVALLLYFLSKNRAWRNTVLLIVSLLFYAWGEPVYILVMIGITVVDYSFGLMFGKAYQPHTKKLLLITCIILNLIPLFLFKYYDFFLSQIGLLLGTSMPVLAVAMPIGISFFTFQSMSYAIDIYRGKAQSQTNYFHVLLYVSMFPQLVAGPIVRYADISQALVSRSETSEGFAEGSFRFAIGLGKKVIFANYAGEVANYLLHSRLDTLSGAAAWIGLLMAMLQLYFDFSGYSDMAIGLGLIFGFRFRENFRYPFIASSVTDFWRRWHISMSSWFRDYIYIPLGGNRVKLGRWFFNIFITWLLTGIWHGASWNFVWWGLFYALFLILEKFLRKTKLPFDRIPVVSSVSTFVLVSLGFVLFFFTDPAEIGAFYAALFGAGQHGFSLQPRELASFYSVSRLLPFMIIGITPLPAMVCKSIFDETTAVFHIARSALSITLTAGCFLLLLGQSYNAFLYFRF